jgi:hypothetical protein
VASDKITLIIMHSPKSAPKSLSISRRLVLAAAGLLVILLAVSIFAGLRVFSHVVNTAKLAELEDQNRLLKDEIARLSGKISSFEDEMAGHVELEERLRILADLEPMDMEVWGVGVGGPELSPSEELGEPMGSMVTGLNQDIDRLLRQLKLQRDSYSEILKRLREKSEELKYIPSIRPVDIGYISSYFGKRHDPFTGRICQHEGLDFSARRGSNICATADGVVIRAKYDRGYGYTIEIDHGNGIVTKYAHNQKLLVKKGQKIKRGQVIAYLGNSGRSTAPHLHYEVRVHGVAEDPLKFILPPDVVVD